MAMQSSTLKGLVLILVFIGLGGCAAMTRSRPHPGDPAWAPATPKEIMRHDPNSGSIFQASRNFNPYGDRVALNVGDILTVQLQEQTASQKSTDTKIQKNDQATFNAANILGGPVSSGSLGLATDPNFKRQFEGKGNDDQSNSLTGSITVSVIGVLPNGVLKVRGEKWLHLGQGDEYVRLEGLVRPADIGPDNTVSSTRVANARIAYGGTGNFDQTNKMGWLARFFNSEWWPF